MEIFTKTFFFPTFTNHLMAKFGLSIEGSSIFFIIHIISYFAVLNYINVISSRLGIKLTITIGLFLNFLGSLFLPPITVLPQIPGTIIFGLLLLGIPSAFINVPGICDLIDILKSENPNSDENVANDMASAIYNLGLNFGEAIGPAFGGYITEKFDFQTSCIYTSLFNLSLAIFFFAINYNIILTQLEEGKAAGESKDEDGIKKGLTSDTDEYKSIKGHKIDSERTYVGRYRAYSYSNRSSRRTSINQSVLSANIK
jgi:MFS family permease